MKTCDGIFQNTPLADLDVQAKERYTQGDHTGLPIEVVI